MKGTIIIVFMMLIPLLSLSQDDAQLSNETYIVLKDSTQVSGQIIEKKNMYSIYRKISFLANGQQNTNEYLPTDILGFKWKYTVYESVGDRFMKLSARGKKITLYEYGDLNSFSSPGTMGANGMMTPGHSGSQPTSDYFLKKDGKKLEKVQKMSFKKVYAEYFKDCKKVSEMIKAKTLTYDNIKTIVVLYNRCD